MRMDQRQQKTAADIIRDHSEQQLHKLFEQFGEVTNAKTLAKTIVTQRQLGPIRTINEFKMAVKPVVKGNPQKYFAQVFQALRIEVNDEFGALREMLQQAVDVLQNGGRIAVITFHSLEDRIVKNFFRNGTFDEAPPDDVYGRRTESPLKIITKKPVTASEAELKQNSRSRSAKLRGGRKKVKVLKKIFNTGMMKEEIKERTAINHVKNRLEKIHQPPVGGEEYSLLSFPGLAGSVDISL